MRSILAILVLSSAIQISVEGMFSKEIDIDVDRTLKKVQSGHIDLQSSYEAMNRELAKKELKPDKIVGLLKKLATLQVSRDSNATDYQMSWTAKLLLALERAFSDGCTPENDSVLKTCVNSVQATGSSEPVELYIAHHASRYANNCLPFYVRMINSRPDIDNRLVYRMSNFMANIAKAQKLLPEKYDDGQFVDSILHIDWTGIENDRVIGKAVAKTLVELQPKAESALRSNDDESISMLLNRTLIHECSVIAHNLYEIFDRVVLVAQVQPRLNELVDDLPSNMIEAVKIAAISKKCYDLGMTDRLLKSLQTYLEARNREDVAFN